MCACRSLLAPGRQLVNLGPNVLEIERSHRIQRISSSSLALEYIVSEPTAVSGCLAACFLSGLRACSVIAPISEQGCITGCDFSRSQACTGGLPAFMFLGGGGWSVSGILSSLICVLRLCQELLCGSFFIHSLLRLHLSSTLWEMIPRKSTVIVQRGTRESIRLFGVIMKLFKLLLNIIIGRHIQGTQRDIHIVICAHHWLILALVNAL